MKEILTTNNMETLNPVEKKVEETKYVDTKKLAEEAIASDVEFKAAMDAEKAASAQEYENIKNKPAGETENKKETAESKEAHLAKRKEFTTKVIQLMVDDLQQKIEKINKKGILAWVDKKINGAEYEEALKQLIGLQTAGRPGIFLSGQFATPSAGRFTSEAVQKEIFSMVSAELEPEDQEAFLGNKKINATVGHNLTDVSAG